MNYSENRNCVSIIVPVYNAAETIVACVKSITDQTYHDLEIILVDDGSTDKSGVVCDRLSAADSRIKVLHKKNGGAADARNAGIKVSTSPYLCFVDSDDIIASEYVECLLSELNNSNSDVVMCGEMFHYDDYVKAYSDGSIVIDFPVTDLSVCDKLVYDLRIGRSTNKIYRRSIIIDNNCFFVPGIVMFEDYVFVWTYLQYCRRFSIIDNILYHYNCFNSTVTKRFNKSQSDDRYSAFLVMKRFIQVSLSISEKQKMYYLAKIAANDLNEVFTYYISIYSRETFLRLLVEKYNNYWVFIEPYIDVLKQEVYVLHYKYLLKHRLFGILYIRFKIDFKIHRYKVKLTRCVNRHVKKRNTTDCN